MTEKPRFSITLDDELLDKVEDFRHEKRISTRSQAIVKLIEMGLDSLEEEINIHDECFIDPNDQLILDGYHAADIPHQEDMIEAAQRAIERGKRKNVKSYILREEVS